MTHLMPKLCGLSAQQEEQHDNSLSEPQQVGNIALSIFKDYHFKDQDKS